jgi:hypothetical protein
MQCHATLDCRMPTHEPGPSGWGVETSRTAVVIRTGYKDVITWIVPRRDYRGESMAVVAESHEARSASQELFNQAEYSVETATGRGDGQQAVWGSSSAPRATRLSRPLSLTVWQFGHLSLTRLTPKIRFFSSSSRSFPLTPNATSSLQMEPGRRHMRGQALGPTDSGSRSVRSWPERRPTNLGRRRLRTEQDR